MISSTHNAGAQPHIESSEQSRSAWVGFSADTVPIITTASGANIFLATDEAALCMLAAVRPGLQVCLVARILLPNSDFGACMQNYRRCLNGVEHSVGVRLFRRGLTHQFCDHVSYESIVRVPAN